jgi:hypothetical protein
VAIDPPNTWYWSTGVMEYFPSPILQYSTSRLLKNLSESFDGAQDERRGFDIVNDFPFMLRFSKHS